MATDGRWAVFGRIMEFAAEVRYFNDLKGERGGPMPTVTLPFAAYGEFSKVVGFAVGQPGPATPWFMLDGVKFVREAAPISFDPVQQVLQQVLMSIDPNQSVQNQLLARILIALEKRP